VAVALRSLVCLGDRDSFSAAAKNKDGLCGLGSSSPQGYVLPRPRQVEVRPLRTAKAVLFHASWIKTIKATGIGGPHSGVPAGRQSPSAKKEKPPFRWLWFEFALI